MRRNKERQDALLDQRFQSWLVAQANDPNSIQHAGAVAFLEQARPLTGKLVNEPKFSFDVE
jgi:hypothetical protein